MIKLNIKIDIESGMKEINKFITNLNKIEKESVQYGYFNGKEHKTEYDKSGISEAYLMTILEFGSESADIPARPVFRRTGENMQSADNSRLFYNPIRNYVLASSRNKDRSDKTLIEIGNIMRKATQDNFGLGTPAHLQRNAEDWSRVKGKNSPLIHTSALMGAMEVRTDKGG